MNGKKGDLIIHEKSILNSHYIKERIVESGLFNRVLLFKDYDSRLNSVFSGENSLSGYLKLVYGKHFSKLDINDFLLGEEVIELEEYDEAYCFNKKFLDILSKYKNIEINLIDDGVGSYTSNIAGSCKIVDKIYLYKPEFAAYYEQFKSKFCTIPGLDSSDEAFKGLLNQIWGYDNNTIIEDDSIIVFDQPSRVIPKYFLYFPKCIRNGILAKTKMYGKYANDEKSRDFFISSIKKLQGSNRNVIVKMHPRSSDALKEQYINEGFKILGNAQIPWEIVSLNLNVESILLVSMLSTVSLSMGMYFKKTNFSCESIFLYEAARRIAGVQSPKETVNFLESISARLSGVKIIKDIDELKELAH